MDETISTFGRLDILFNNIAQQLENHDVLELSSQQWLDTFQVNVHPFFFLSKAAIPHMKPGSAIINNASINAYVGRPDLLDYTSTKGTLPIPLRECVCDILFKVLSSPSQEGFQTKLWAKSRFVSTQSPLVPSSPHSCLPRFQRVTWRVQTKSLLDDQVSRLNAHQLLCSCEFIMIYNFRLKN